MTSRDKLIEQMKKVLSVRGQYQVDYHAGKFTVNGNKARFIQWPEFMADLILADHKRICEPLVKCKGCKIQGQFKGGKDYRDEVLKAHEAIDETLSRAGVEK